jgi:hypothetical protein
LKTFFECIKKPKVGEFNASFVTFYPKGTPKQPDSSPPLINQNIQQQKIIIPTSKSLRIFTMSALAIDVLFTPFLWKAVIDAINQAAKDFGTEISPEIQTSIYYGTMLPAIGNLFNDLLLMDPIYEADQLAFALRKKNPRDQKLMFALIFALQILITLTSHMVGAMTDDIPIADAINQTIHNEMLAAFLRYIALILTVPPITLYYILFINHRIKEHVHALVATLKDLPAFGKRFFQYPGALATVAIETFLNSIHRGAVLSFVAQDAMKLIFPFSPPALSRYLSITTGITSFAGTVLSRTLSHSNKWANPQRSFLNAQDRQKVKWDALKWCKEFPLDILLSFLRAVAIFIIIINILPAPTNYILAGPGAAGMGGFTAKVFYSARADQKVLENIPESELKQRQQAIQPKPQPSEITPLLAESHDPMTQAIENIQVNFKKIAVKQGSTMMDNTIGMFVSSAQSMRVIAFYGFLSILNSFFSLGLTPRLIFAFTMLIGLALALSNASIYQESIGETCRGYKTRWKLEEKQEESLKTKPDETKNVWSSAKSYAGRFYRAIKKSPFDYDPSLLEAVAQELEKPRMAV